MTATHLCGLLLPARLGLRCLRIRPALQLCTHFHAYYVRGVDPHVQAKGYERMLGLNLQCATCTPPPPCISYANVRNYYGPYAYCSLDTGVAYAQ